MLPPTSEELLDETTKPYFLWWLDCSIAEFRQHLASDDMGERAYYLGALLREANTRDVWLFTTPQEIRRCWPWVRRHLGQTAARWAWLLDIDDAASSPRGGS